MRKLPSRIARIWLTAVLIVVFSGYHFTASAGRDNGFDLSNSILDVDQILHGGPPRDGIPAAGGRKI